MHFASAKGLLSSHNSMNIYRGCTHGCIYCDSRSVCYGFTHPFEDVEVKENAPELLENSLRSKRSRAVICTGAMCDPYQQCETELELMRRCLEIIGRYSFGASVHTKSDRVLRDVDLLDSINRKAKSVLQMTLTTSDEELCAIVEPNVCGTYRRYEVLKEFQKREIPSVVWLCPFLPFLNDTESNLRRLLDYCFDAGVKGIICFGIGLTLREGDREYFYAALDKHFPGLSEKYRRTYGGSYEVTSPENGRLMRLLHEECSKHGVIDTPEKCFEYIASLPERNTQTTLFD